MRIFIQYHWRVRSAAIARVLTAVALAASFVLLQLDAPAGANFNPQFAVVPSLREWQSAGGYLSLSHGTRVVVDSADAGAVTPTAEAIQADLAAVTGARPAMATGLRPTPVDVFVSLHTSDEGLGTEGYTLEVGAGVAIRAHSPAGIFYGSRSLLQMLVAGQTLSLPRGRGRDYPRYSERGLVLDVSSRFVPISMLKKFVRHLAWYKFNDLQLELNDNGGFRLDSPAFPGLAAKDWSYSESDFRDLEAYALARGMTITPELDSPGHAAALTRYRPDLANPKNANFIDLANAQALSFMASLWIAFLPWFTSPSVAIGADEYDTADGDGYRSYVNLMDTLIRQHGKSVRMWGSLSRESGHVPVHTDITLQQWDTSWSDPTAMDQLGFATINTSSELLYIVTPKSPWFADHIDTRSLYDRWSPGVFSLGNTAFNLPAGDPRLQGAMFAFWGDASSQDAFDRVHSAMPVVGEKLWNDASAALTYQAFATAAERSALH